MTLNHEASEIQFRFGVNGWFVVLKSMYEETELKLSLSPAAARKALCHKGFTPLGEKLVLLYAESGASS